MTTHAKTASNTYHWTLRVEKMTAAEKLNRTATAPTQNWKVGFYLGNNMVSSRDTGPVVLSRGWA